MIRVLVNGALGRMGSEVCKKVYSEADLELVGAVDIKEGVVALGDGVKGCHSTSALTLSSASMLPLHRLLMLSAPLS